MKCLENINRIQIGNNLMIQLFNLYYQKGKAHYYKDIFASDESKIIKQTLEHDIIAIGEFLELNITKPRLKLLASQRREYVAKNNEEKLLLNIKSALERIQSLGDDFSLILNEVIDLTNILFRDLKKVKFVKKGVLKEGIIIPFEKMPSKDQLTNLFIKFNQIRRHKKHELLTIISNFYVDFVMIRPYTEHNELIALILIYTIIAKEFKVCSYDSFFTTLNRFKKRFADALVFSFYDWDNGNSQTEPLTKVFVDALEIMHTNVETLERAYRFDSNLNKTDIIEAIIMRGPSVFSKKDIREQVPLASESTINRTLSLLKAQKIIVPLGQGRSAKWQRVVGRTEKFKVESLNLFNE
ncbi:MAG: hypothetical protein GX931_00840 [Acholeplasmataceae bacterium]|nr:hypothetical protein [Acholeplasmataceae bacterium]